MSVETVLEHKSVARAAAFERRRLAKNKQNAGDACALLSEHIAQFGNGNVIAGYMPIQSEISPVPAMNALLDQGNTLCVPVIQGKGKPLLFREWDPDTPMIEGDFGALIPRRGGYVEPTILVVPLVAFDSHGHRLGYGGGYYDRSLESLRMNRKVHAVGFAFSMQQADNLPTDATDQRLDAVVTELGVTLFT